MRSFPVRSLPRTLLALLCILASGVASFDEIRPCASADKFEVGEDCSIDPLVVGRVMGRAARQGPEGQTSPDEKPAGCLSLFTADSHEFVKSAKTNRDGKFDFGEVPPGSYRLIARSPGFCTGNIPVKVVRLPRYQNRSIVVLFRLASTDVCTCAVYDRGPTGRRNGSMKGDVK